MPVHDDNNKLRNKGIFQPDKDICDIVIYNKKYIFGLVSLSVRELLKPVEST